MPKYKTSLEDVFGDDSNQDVWQHLSPTGYKKLKDDLVSNNKSKVRPRRPPQKFVEDDRNDFSKRR